MKPLALLLSLLALGALGLVACGGSDDDEATAASATETTDDRTTDDALAADSKSCGVYERWRLAVVKGGISCREARRVVHGYIDQGPTPDGWSCIGGDQPVKCRSEAGERIGAPVRNAVLRRWAVERAGNLWAAAFATGRHTCRYMVGQPACEREACVRVGSGPIKNCTPPSPEFRESFAGATVERVVFDGRDATAEFSNGESVKFEGQKVDKGDIEAWGRRAWFITGEWVKKIARRNFEP